MQAGSVASIEKNVDGAASALFALACGYAAYAWISPTAGLPTAAAESAAAAMLAYFLTNRTLRRIQPEAPRIRVPIFDVRDVEPIGEPELLLTERLDPAPAGEEDALLLDDILAELGPDSRVVRLFDPAAMPTAGELKSRIDRHLDRETSAAQTSDAAQALNDALAELRRSMR